MAEDVRAWDGSKWLSLTGPVGPQGPQGQRGLMGPQGDPGRSVNIIGTLPSPQDLPPTGDPGDAYLINGDLWVWDDLNTRWADVGRIEGPQGIQGEKGDKGDKGDTGPANSLSIGTVVKGDQAAASITGTPPAQTLSLTLPKGDQGIPGEAATIAVGTVTTLPAGAQATVTNRGTADAATFDFGIPKGADGAGDIIPIGSIFPFAAAAVPDGWLLCDGSAFDPGTYPKLAAAIGSAFGSKVPDLRGRFALGADPGRALGATGGSATINQVVAHTHTVSGSVAVDAAGGLGVSGSVAVDSTQATTSPAEGYTASRAALNVTGSNQGYSGYGAQNGAHSHSGIVNSGTLSSSSNTTTGGSAARVTGASNTSTNQEVSHAHGMDHGHSFNGFTDAHNHSFSANVTIPGHGHSGSLSNAFTSGHGHTGSLTGGSAASTGSATVDVLNPFLAINYIIKAA